MIHGLKQGGRWLHQVLPQLRQRQHRFAHGLGPSGRHLVLPAYVFAHALPSSRLAGLDVILEFCPGGFHSSSTSSQVISLNEN